MSKVCNKCGEAKHIGSFNRNPGCKSDGLRGTCKECEKTRSWYGGDPQVMYDYERTLKGRLNRLVISSKNSANKKGLDFNLTYGFIRELWEAQGGKCLKTGIQLTLDVGSVPNRNPHGPSIDRVDSNLGYVIGNVQLVCIHYNLAKNVYTDAQLLQLAEGILKMS